MDIYKDIANRTNGEIYIGVVGPVRTGKSTFIKRFMDLCVIPYIEDENIKERTIDELPQSSQGKTIMTTEPKFIPQNAVTVRLDENQEVKIRLVDCVGFVVEGANGHMEENGVRMVRTPWFEEEIPFTEAAKIGTLKVIQEHATIGVVVTTDGSFGEIPRNNYIEAEERTIAEMEETKKPYVILLNSERPYSGETLQLKEELEQKYMRPVVAINCRQLQKSDITRLLESALLEFPISAVEFYIPKWTEMLQSDHKVKRALIDYAMNWLTNVSRMRDLYTDGDADRGNQKSSTQNSMPSNPQLINHTGSTEMAQNTMGLNHASQNGIISNVYQNYGNTTDVIIHPSIRRIRTEEGSVELRMELEDEEYYAYLSDITGMEIDSEYRMISMIKDLAAKRQEYEKVEHAMESVWGRGYGVVEPELSDITMEEPILIAHAGKYGVKIRANSPSIHMIKANIETEIAPIVGSKEQAEDLINYIKEGEMSKEGVWEANIFGKSLGSLMEDGIREKISKMDDTCQVQLQNTMQKVVNDNNGGMVCIII